LNGGPQLGPIKEKTDAEQILMQLECIGFNDQKTNKYLGCDGYITWGLKSEASVNQNSTDSDSSATDEYCDLI